MELTRDVQSEVARVTAALEPLGPRVVPMGPIATTYRVGGPAALLVEAGSVEDLELLAEAVAGTGLPFLVVGRGSNLLVSDRGFPGIAVTLAAEAFAEVAVEGSKVTAGASVALPTLARQSVEAGLTGLEWAVGVPGSVGGGIRMNAGGHGSDMASTMSECRLIDLSDPEAELVSRDLAAMGYSYRHSSVRPAEVVVSADFALAPGSVDEGRKTVREIVRWRREHQPGGQNAGSVFTNPVGDSAGRLIDSAGLKGLRQGTAMVSPKHANFIQAEPGGSADDVHRLILRIRDEVARIHGVELKPEVRTVGFEKEPSTSSTELSDKGDVR